MLLRALTLALAAVAPPSLRARPSCVAASDSVSVAFLSSIRVFASSADPVYVDARTRNGVAHTSASNVTYVTDERVCRRIARSVSAAAVQAGYTPTGRVRAVKVGDVFVAQDPGVTWSRSPLTFHLTTAFTVTRRVGAT